MLAYLDRNPDWPGLSPGSETVRHDRESRHPVMNWRSERIPEWEGMPNTTFQELFPSWDFAWWIDVNDDVVIKHSWRGGNFAPCNNAAQSGKTCITGHLHRAQVIGFTAHRSLMRARHEPKRSGKIEGRRPGRAPINRDRSAIAG